MENLLSNIKEASLEGNLLESASINISEFLKANPKPFYINVIQELYDKCLWEELNDRFYKKLSLSQQYISDLINDFDNSSNNL